MTSCETTGDPEQEAHYVRLLPEVRVVEQLSSHGARLKRTCAPSSQAELPCLSGVQVPLKRSPIARPWQSPRLQPKGSTYAGRAGSMCDAPFWLPALTSWREFSSSYRAALQLSASTTSSPLHFRQSSVGRDCQHHGNSPSPATAASGLLNWRRSRLPRYAELTTNWGRLHRRSCLKLPHIARQRRYLCFSLNSSFASRPELISFVIHESRQRGREGEHPRCESLAQDNSPPSTRSTRSPPRLVLPH